MTFLSRMLLLASLGVSPAAYAAGVPPTVIDATGKVVGTLIGQNRIMREIGGVMVGLTLEPRGFTPTSGNVLYWTTDCTGTKFLGNQGIPLSPYTQVPGNEFSGTVTVFYPAGASRTVIVRSYQLSTGGPCTTLPSPVATPVGVVHSGTLKFTPPFAIQ